MNENELLKKINREIKITSLENSEKQKNEKEELIVKEEDEDNDDNKNNNNTDNNELENDNKNNTEDAVEKIAKENIDDFKDEVSTDILSSDPKLLAPEELPLERNEIDDVDSVDGILNDVKQDKTSDFIDPDSKAENNLHLKVVDTSLGVFTILNYDENSVLLMDCNKQKIQISLDDFNNLHPFEIKDEQLSSINDFTDAYKKDLKAEEDSKNNSDDNSESEKDDQSNDQEEEEEFDYENSEDEENANLSDINFGESLDRNNLNDKKDSNLLSEIQKRLSKKQGVSETIRSDVRSKNRCVLVAKKSKLSKDKELSFNETKPRSKSTKSKTFESKKIIKKETTQPSAIITPPKPLSDKKDDFNIKKVLTIKDGKFIYVKLEGKTQIAYLKLKRKNNLLSINKLNESLKQVDSFFESLNCICNNFYILEKEIVMKNFRKYESEDIDNELEIDDVDVNDEDDDVEFEEDEVVDDEDVEEDYDEENKEEESEDENEKDSIHFSTEINGVRYSGTLYRDDHDEVVSEDEEEDVEEEDVEDESDDDLILTSEEELDSLDFPEGMDESVIKARARIYGKRYNVSFCNVKQESVKRAKLEMRRHNIVEAWNALVKGAKSIKC